MEDGWEEGCLFAVKASRRFEALRCLDGLWLIALLEYGYGLVLDCIRGYDIREIAVIESDYIFIDSFAWYRILIPQCKPCRGRLFLSWCFSRLQRRTENAI